VRIDSQLLQRIVDHARAEAPNECCGWVGLRDGVAVRAIEVRNVAASPFRFEMDGPDLLRTTSELEDEGLDPVIYHSHTRSDPVPSQTDLNFAARWPGVPWLIVGLAGEHADVRVWAIADGRAEAAALHVDEP
jgi:[CysO sulfur-carrier protein]-S-L-cysteine hydrolase